MEEEGRAPKIKNRAPAPVQITAEQLLREAQENQERPRRQTARHRIEDYEQLEEYRARKRKEFEDSVRKLRGNMVAWIRYATWEANQGLMDRARSVFERAIDVNPHHVPLWLRYTEQELKMRNVNFARNLFDRAVSILPRIDQLWYKYVHVEELLGNVSGTREIFERWMSWEPDERAWNAYIAFEVRYKEMDRASAVWERAVTCHPEPKQWIRWAKYEEDRDDLDKARNVFHMALDFFGEDEAALERAQTVFTAFAKMETRQAEYDRARMIYKYALERLPRAKSEGIYASYTRFEKQFGNIKGVEDTVTQKRRLQYEEEVQSGLATNYDTWFDYTRLEEESYRTLLEEGAPESMLESSREKVREVYERAIAEVPPANEKRLWRRYIYLWLRYALFEEADVGDIERAKKVYAAAVAAVPHREFTFAKLWLAYAYFEVRRMDLALARKILGTAIGLAPKQKLFAGYIQLELELKEFDRVRKLYEKALEWDPSSSSTWVRFAELEQNLYDLERARGIYELAIAQAESELGGLDMPEVVWKAYIDFEFSEREMERVDALYERLLDKTGHVKVWISYALGKMAAAIAAEEDEDADAEEEVEAQGETYAVSPEQQAERAARREQAAKETRAVFARGYESLRDQGLKDERVVLLEAWKAFEVEHGDEERVQAVQEKMPRVLKKRREIPGGDGAMEEYYDMVFPDEEAKNKPAMKLLQMAHAWRAQQAS
ncbi:NineTeen Complex (NTC) component [Malassezia japonica]|uniref:NineTeen Complex (NTC) component n=1 Tax=Malassezia japonica TaxID=223818 RepID=A0AAF0EXX3_9BASI|nr:NineTeen Complex (NTC) component [Malassezia japonica]WFD37100.1 NineTeen Complex (NTC) component [Malassezia japonica]